LLVPKLERDIGIEVYATRSPGIGGAIKRDVEDFVVEEVLVDGSKAQENEPNSDVGKSVIGSSGRKSSFLLCTLVKRNWDTFISLAKIAYQLGIRPSQIQFAGIKDARAVTSQFITIKDGSVEDVQSLHLKDVQVRPIGYLRAALSSYFLLGNSFHIAIKTVKHSATTTRRRFVKIADEIKVSGGVPNFFGHQRFGTVRPITHLVGKAIVKGSLENAVMLFLAKSSPDEHPTSREARLELWQTRSLEKAMCDFPKQLRYERLMLKSLAERPCDFAAALRRLPPRLCELFVQGYQSYLFNRSLSERIKKGLSLSAAEVGDYAVSVERSGLPMLTMFKRVSHDNRAEVNKAVEKGKMRLAIPLIGHRQCPSEGVQGDIERRILEEEGVSPSDFRVACLAELSAKGRLRSVIAPVKDLSFECLRDRSAEKLRSRVNVDFMLYRGSYATVVLREFMKAWNLIAAGF